MRRSVSPTRGSVAALGLDHELEPVVDWQRATPLEAGPAGGRAFELAIGAAKPEREGGRAKQSGAAVGIGAPLARQFGLEVLERGGFVSDRMEHVGRDCLKAMEASEDSDVAVVGGVEDEGGLAVGELGELAGKVGHGVGRFYQRVDGSADRLISASQRRDRGRWQPVGGDVEVDPDPWAASVCLKRQLSAE